MGLVDAQAAGPEQMAEAVVTWGGETQRTFYQLLHDTQVLHEASFWSLILALEQ